MNLLVLSGSQTISNPNLLVRHRQIEVCEGTTLRLTSGFSLNGIHLKDQFDCDGPQACFNFCLSGKQNFELTGNYTPAAADSRHPNVLLLPKETFSVATESAGEFATVFLSISLKKYLSILGDAADMLPRNYQIAAETDNLCYFKNYDWQPRLRQVLNQLLREDWQSPLSQRIFYESKMLEIIALMLEMQHRAGATLGQFLPKKDEEKIRHARQILEQNLANPPSLAQLARQIASNEFTLKRGFKLLFGMPVFKFLQKLRMERAAELLLDSQLQVAEIAEAVGYENVSAFTRAFSEEHRILPSDLRKTPFRHS